MSPLFSLFTRWGALLLVLLFFVPSTASAESSGSDLADAEAISALARIGIEVEPSKAWRRGEVSALWRGASALPSFMHIEGDEPITLRRVRRACHYGMGRYNDTCPTFDKHERVFFLYDIPPIQGEGATRKLGALTHSERAELLRRRAAIHLMVALFDGRRGWSDDRRWRAVNGWNRRGTKAFNLDVWGYSRFLGMRSAHFDLVTFAEEFFARPEDVLRTSSAPDAPQRLDSFDWDITLECQQFTKVRLVSKAIARRDPTWTPPKRGPEGALPLQQCAQFQQWAQLHALEGIDLLLAAATSDRPESLYGHLLLAVRYKDGATLRSRGFEPVYQFGAITDTDVSILDYFTKGLFGGFDSLIQPNTFRGVDRLFLQYEQRALRRYALNLSPAQNAHMMQRLWEAERHIIYPYYFLSDNCASMLIDLVEPVVDDLDVPQGLRWVMMPTEVLDVLARVDNGDRGPLLVKRPQTHFSSREVAMDAVLKRRSVRQDLFGLAANEGVDAELIRRLRALDGALDTRDSGVRTKTYAEIEHVLSALVEPIEATARSRAVALAIDYLFYASRIERYFMDVAFYRRRQIFAGALLEPQRYTAEEQLQLRRDLYQIEDLRQRQEALTSLMQLADARLREGERRPLTQEEKLELEEIERTQQSYLAALDLLATTIERFDPQLDGVAYIEAKALDFEVMQRKRDDRAMGPPGKGRFIAGLSGGARPEPGRGERIPSAQRLWGELSASLVHERLGEQRRRGFRADISSRALGLDLTLPFSGDMLRSIDADATLFEFKSIEQKMGAVRTSWRQAFGWGVRLGLTHDGRRGVDIGADIEIGPILPIWTQDNVASFWIAGAYASVGADNGTMQGAILTGAKAFTTAQFHLYGRYGNILRLHAETYQFFDLLGLDYDTMTSARIQLEHIVAEFNQQLLILQPYVMGEYTTLNYLTPQDARDPWVQWRAGLRFELPF